MMLLLLSTLPGLLICFIVVRADKYEREPLLPLLMCFMLGASLTFPAVRLETWAAQDLHTYSSISDTFFLAFGAVAWWEELLKFTVLLIFVYPRSFFNEPIDGIVYAVMVSMGFASLENVAYADRFGVQSVLIRAFTAVPAHLVFAVVMGYFLGLAKFGKGVPGKQKPSKPARNLLIFKGFVLAFLLHGIYDLMIFQSWFEWLFVLGTSGMYLCLFFCNELVREHLENSPFKERGNNNLSV